MSLIDEAIKKESDQKKLLCKNCENKEIEENSIILLCENCFNENTRESLNKIKENVLSIIDNLKKINEDIPKLKNELEKENLHIIIRNKYQIDLLNIESINKKLIIDKELNEKAFELNQHQANDVRKIMKWSLFEVTTIKELLGDKYE